MNPVYFTFVILFIPWICCNQLNTMLDAVLFNCNNFAGIYNETELATFKNQPIFMECKNWTAINSMNSIEQLSEENKNNIRCLLYMETLLSYSSQNVPYQQKNRKMLYTDSSESYNATIDLVCKNLSLFPQPVAGYDIIPKIIKDESACQYLCMEYRAGKPALNHICSKAYYLNTKLKSQPESGNSSEKTGVLSGQSLQQTIDAVKSDLEKSSDAKNNTAMKNSPKSDLVNVVMGTMNVNTKKNDSAENLSHDNNNEESIPTQNLKNNIGQGPGQSPIVDTTKISNNKNTLLAQNEEEISEAQNQNHQISEVNKPINPDIQKEQSSLIEDKIDSSKTTTYHESSDNLAEQNGDTGPSDDEVIQKIDANVDVFRNQQPSPDNVKKGISNPGVIGDYIDSNDEKPKEKSEQPETQENKEMPIHEEEADRFVAKKFEVYSYADMDGNSHFFTYFSFTCVIFVLGYVGYHNKQKVLALMLEGRTSRRPQRGRRPNSANYHKLDTNLEEAISSSCSKNTSHIIY